MELPDLDLMESCINGDLSTIKNLVTKYGLNPNDARDPSGLTPLHLACKNGHLDIAQYLIKEQNCNPEATNPRGSTPLHWACLCGHLQIAKCLITDYKCNPLYANNDGSTPLHAACNGGNLEIVKYFICDRATV